MAPSRNSTDPVGVAPPATTAFSVVALDSSDGFGFVVRVVVVAERTVVVPGPSKVTLERRRSDRWSRWTARACTPCPAVSATAWVTSTKARQFVSGVAGLKSPE